MAPRGRARKGNLLLLPPWLSAPCAARKARVRLFKEFRRGLIALAVLCGIGIITFATVASSSTFRTHAKEALASHLKKAR